MPRTLKRRSDAISREEEDESPDPTPGPSTQRRQRSSSASSVGVNSGSDSANEAETQSSNQTANIQTLAKKLIRLALSSEYSRNPLRRTDIAQKIFKESNASPRLFKQVFNTAQQQLNEIFGMKMVELPSREKTTLKDRRTQATQPGTSTTKSQSWVLVSTLPQPYKTHPMISRPTLAPSQDVEASYTALYTFILSLIFLNNSSLPEAKMERYLKRVNADTYTPFGSLEKLLQRMVKDGYIEKRRDTTSGEEVVELVPGPRGKVEVGVNGVAGLVRAVYGFGSVGLDGKYVGHTGVPTSNSRNGDQGQNNEAQTNGEDEETATTEPTTKIERQELEQRLQRSLGASLEFIEKPSVSQPINVDVDTTTTDAMDVDDPPDRPGRSKPTRRGRNHANNDDDDDEDQDFP